MIFRLDRVDEGIRPTHDLKGFNIFADKVTDNFDTVASHINNGTAACLLNIPEPVAVRSRVGFAGTNPQNLSNRAVFDRFKRFERLRWVDQILKIPVKDTRAFNHIKHPFGFSCVASQRFRTQDGFARFGSHRNGFLVQVVGETDDNHIGFRIVNGFSEVGRRFRDVPLLCKIFRPLFSA